MKRIFMHTLDERDKRKIIDLITVLVPNAKIYLFGSRARGTNTERSDIDLALDAGEKIPRRIVHEIKDVLEATNIVNSIDVIDLNGAISDSLRSVILKEGVLWKS
jgi:predicted nucleotidyltransferase